MVTRSKVLKMTEYEDSDWESSDLESEVDLNQTKHGSSLLIQDLPQDTSKEQLELYFGNPHPGGGEILQIYVNGEKSSTVVKFKDSRDTQFWEFFFFPFHAFKNINCLLF